MTVPSLKVDDIIDNENGTSTVMVTVDSATVARLVEFALSSILEDSFREKVEWF
jgi:hypothetical protein